MSETYTYSTAYDHYRVYLKKAAYANTRVALLLMSTEDGSQVACATVNIPEHDLQPGEIIVKTWSENESMLDFLIRNHIVEDTGREIPTGFVRARVCKLLV